MEMFSIHCFITLAHRLRFYEAAEAMHLSQSSFSRQIQLLERSFGTKLFIRTRQGCELTESGRAFLPYAESIAREFTKAEQLVEAYRKGGVQRLTVYTDCFPNNGLSDMILRFQDAHPGIFLEIRELDGRQAIRSMQTDPYVSCIIYSGLDERLSGLDHFPLFRDDLVALVGVSHPLAAHSGLKLAMLEDEMFQLMCHPQTQIYDFIIGMCERAGFSPKISPHKLWYSTTPEAIVSLELVSITPRSIAERISTPDMRILELEDAEAYCVRVVKDENASNTARLFYEFCRLSDRGEL